MVGAVSAAFALGGLSVSLDGTGAAAAATAAIGLAGVTMWYLDVKTELPELDHGEAAESLRNAAEELDRLDELTREALREEIDADVLDVEREEIETIEDLDRLRDLAERSGLDEDVVEEQGDPA